MIQRIQSLYLFLAAVAASMIYVFPIATYDYSGGLEVTFGLISRSSEVEMDAFMFLGAWPGILVVGFLVLILLCLGTIFLFRNRTLQMRLVMAAVILNIGLLISVFLASDHLSSELNVSGNMNAEANFGIGSYMPVISLLFLILAFRGIKKDERLVRSVDRIR